MTASIRIYLKSNYILFKAVRKLLAVTGYFKREVNAELDEFWKIRVDIVVTSPDNSKIARVPDAGKVKGDIQIMHNGIKIHVGSYYGDENTVLLYRNRGVHEPQEEKVFEEILNHLPGKSSMLELGAFWGFYSMSFQRKVADAINYLVEPDPYALLSGKHNFRLNGYKGYFYNYFISDKEHAGRIPTTTVDAFMHDQHIEHLAILHSDIQGFELKMLQGATEGLRAGKIDYVFISTHSNDLHDACAALLEKMDYQVLCTANLDETYSWDGLLVAKHRTVRMPETLDISVRT